MIVYHASNVEIQKFKFGENGVHFGGLNSAIEAGLRKADAFSENEIYLHTCELTLSKEHIYESDDVGCAEEWLVEIEEAKRNGKKAIKYINRYEPCSKASYLVIDPNIIKLVSMVKMDYDEAEEKLLARIYDH